MQARTNRFVVSCLVFGGTALATVAALSESAESLLRRYPFDPACVWGRLANGKGTVVRCLSEKEATTLAAAPAPAPLASLPPVTTSAVAAPSSSAGAAAAPVAPVDPSAKAERFEVTIGPVIADKGELGIGKLGTPRDRYVKCLEDNGGIKGDTGEVHVRFLVRSRGIAEGVSVEKRINVGPEAARCIAEVVDRRHVGVPDEPLVGATLIVKITRAVER